MILRKANKKKLKDCLETKINAGDICPHTHLVIDGVRIYGDVILSFKDKNDRQQKIDLFDLNSIEQGFNCSYIKDYYIESIKSSFTVDYSDHWITPMVTVNLVKEKNE